jgi:hypothetical protein
MNTAIRKLMLVLATVACGALWVPVASAGCGNPSLGKAPHVSPQAWRGQDTLAPGFLLISDHGSSIVGMWHVAFIAEGNGPGLPPDGAQVDASFSQYHPDGTENQVSSRAPDTGDVCLGVWKRVGERHYKLNHFGISFDPSTDPNNPQGLADIHQDIWLSPDGKTFKGTFTIDQFDATGNLLVEIKGNLVGTRVTLGTTVPDLVGS